MLVLMELLKKSNFSQNKCYQYPLDKIFSARLQTMSRSSSSLHSALWKSLVYGDVSVGAGGIFNCFTCLLFVQCSYCHCGNCGNCSFSVHKNTKTEIIGEHTSISWILSMDQCCKTVLNTTRPKNASLRSAPRWIVKWLRSMSSCVHWTNSSFTHF